MTILDTLSLTLIMLSLAALPSSSVALVVTQSATLGVRHGVAVSLGIVLGDLVFVMLALLGLSALAETMGGFFVVIRYLGGAYLIWIGYSLLKAGFASPTLNAEAMSSTTRNDSVAEAPNQTVSTAATNCISSTDSTDSTTSPRPSPRGNIAVSLGAGFLLTLGDVKAIFFYVSLFPTFIDLTAVSTIDVLIIVAITIVAVGGVKVVYAIGASRIAGLTKGMSLQRSAKKMAGGLMVGVGGYLILKP